MKIPYNKKRENKKNKLNMNINKQEYPNNQLPFHTKTLKNNSFKFEEKTSLH